MLPFRLNPTPTQPCPSKESEIVREFAPEGYWWRVTSVEGDKLRWKEQESWEPNSEAEAKTGDIVSRIKIEEAGCYEYEYII